MKLGVAGMMPSSWRQIDLAATQRVRRAGFCGASLFIQDPLAAEEDQVLRVKAAFDQAGLEVAQANGWYEVLVHPDEERRSAGIRGLGALCRIARWVAAPTVYVRPGSLNPNGAWWPHPENHTQQTFDRLVDSMRRVCLDAEQEDVILGIEGHVLSPLDSAQRIADLFSAVGSRILKFNVDPVNFVGTVPDVYDTGRVVNELFDLLGADTVAAHAKDCALGDALVVHIEEVVLGTGFMDYETFLRRFEACCPGGYMLIEHLPDEKVPQARQAILQLAGRLGIKMEM